MSDDWKRARGYGLHPADQYRAGQAVFWLYETRRGYGYTWAVPATVVRTGRVRVRIAAELEQGGTREIWVSPDNLKPRLRRTGSSAPAPADAAADAPQSVDKD